MENIPPIAVNTRNLWNKTRGGQMYSARPAVVQTDSILFGKVECRSHLGHLGIAHAFWLEAHVFGGDVYEG